MDEKRLKHAHYDTLLAAPWLDDHGLTHSILEEKEMVAGEGEYDLNMEKTLAKSRLIE